MCSSILGGLEVDWITSRVVLLDLNTGIPKFCQSRNYGCFQMHTKNHILALPEPILMILRARIQLSIAPMNSRGFRSQLDVFWEPKLNLNQSLTWVTICAYTINLKSKCATSEYQLFTTFLAFSESANQTERENAHGAMKSRKSVKMGHPNSHKG